MTTAVAVIGLGNLGAAMAEHAASLRPLVLVDTDEARRREVAERLTTTTTIAAAGSVAEVDWARIERALVVVRTTEQALGVVDEIAALAPHEIAVHLHATLDPQAAAALAQRPVGRIRLLEQPVSGGAARAATGGLTVLTAGPAVTADHRWLLETAAEIVPFERYGEPTLAKLVNNVAAAANAHTATTLLALARELGIDAGRMWHVLRAGSGGSWMTDALTQVGDDQVRLLAKDIDLLARVAGERMPAYVESDVDVLLQHHRSVRALLTSGDGGA